MSVTHILEQSGANWQYTNPGGNSTSAVQPTRTPTTVHPTLVLDASVAARGDGVVPCSVKGATGKRQIKLLPVGAGAATNTFTMYVLGWSPSRSGGDGSPEGQQYALALWIPVLLGTFTATLGTAVGIGGSDVANTQLFATTITATGQLSDFLNVLITPGSNNIGMAVVETWGFRYIECTFNRGVSATSANCLYAFV
jgi:hypothetical protein